MWHPLPILPQSHSTGRRSQDCTNIAHPLHRRHPPPPLPLHSCLHRALPPFSTVARLHRQQPPPRRSYSTLCHPTLHTMAVPPGRQASSPHSTHLPSSLHPAVSHHTQLRSLAPPLLPFHLQFFIYPHGSAFLPFPAAQSIATVRWERHLGKPVRCLKEGKR